MILRNINVSVSSPFDPSNEPPKDHLENSMIFLEKPGKINLSQIKVNSLTPLAG